LRQLVQLVPAKKRAYTRDTGISAYCDRGACRAWHHCPELPNAKGFTSAPNSQLREENRPAISAGDEESDDRKKWQEDNAGNCRTNAVYDGSVNMTLLLKRTIHSGVRKR
jgi:hypothetical protein